MSQFKALKQRLEPLLRLLPYGRDLYLSLLAPRRGLSYSKVFSNYSEATAYVASLPSCGESFNQSKTARLLSGEEQVETRFFQEDYALLYWLSHILSEDDAKAIYELGGSLGNFFYSANRYFDWPSDLKWTIAELPEAVKVGQMLAEQRDEERLLFVDSSANATDVRADIFLSAGTLQYIPKKVEDILEGMASLPKHVLLHRQSVTAVDSFWTLQNLGKTKVPYFIQNEDDFDSDLSRLGYQKVDWTEVRTAEIAWHEGKTAHRYKGAYFRLIEEAAREKSQ